MAIKYTYINFVIDMEALFKDYERWMLREGLNTKDVNEMFGGLHSAMHSWQTGRHMPTMERFLRCCNAMDADPRKYFVLDEGLS